MAEVILKTTATNGGQNQQQTLFGEPQDAQPSTPKHHKKRSNRVRVCRNCQTEYVKIICSDCNHLLPHRPAITKILQSALDYINAWENR